MARRLRGSSERTTRAPPAPATARRHQRGRNAHMMPPDSLKLRVLEAVRQRPMPRRTDRLPFTIALAALAAVAMSAVLQWGPRLFGDVGGLAHAVGRPAGERSLDPRRHRRPGPLLHLARASVPALDALAAARPAPGRGHRRAAAGRGVAGALAHHLRRSLHPHRLALLRAHGPDRPLALRDPRLRQPPRGAAVPRDGWSGPRGRGRRLGGGDGRAMVPAGGARSTSSSDTSCPSSSSRWRARPSASGCSGCGGCSDKTDWRR